MENTWIIRGGRIVDPAAGRDEHADLCIRDGVICDPAAAPGSAAVIDAGGLVITPGFIDLHVHFRDPGLPEAETIESGSLAAARGGFTTVVMMPNTKPPLDTADRIRDVLSRGRACGKVRALPSGCITAGRAGRELAPLQAMAGAGAVAFTDDGNAVADDDLMRAAMKQARALDLPLMQHAMDPDLAGSAAVRSGPASTGLGIPGLPPEAETQLVARDLELCRSIPARLHVQHISTAGSVDLLRTARKEGLPVSGEATPHHLAFVDTDAAGGDTNFKMNPPLGTIRDREALIAGICDGTVAALATDHAPHTAASKQSSFQDAPFGVTGLETAMAATYKALVLAGHLSLASWVARWTTGPAAILGLPTPTLSPGEPADIAILDLNASGTVEPGSMLSRSVNSPFIGREMPGRVCYTFCAGRMTWGS